MKTYEISLFPIPGSVSLPYSIVPLHVFEPRYRKMIKDSIGQKRRIGVAHTKRVIAPSKMPMNANELDFLNSNQESYEAYPIFSAGFAEILETLPDGRLIVQIKMDSRFEIVEELQQIPYKIIKCTPYNDTDLNENSMTIKKLRHNLDLMFIDLASADQSGLKTFIESSEWTEIPLEEYSFAIYSLVALEPDNLQKVLELKSPIERISFLNDVLSLKFLQ